MKTLIIGLIISLVLPLCSSAQVDEIKKESSKKSEGRSNESSSSSSSSSSSNAGDSFAAGFFFDMSRLAFGGIAMWQQHRLDQRPTNPTIVSFDVMLQGAIQPSTYYILQPRIRGNWGLFSTDFRFNYLIEEDVEGMKHIRTDDWQILELNIFNSKNFTGRIGGGILHENYSGGKTFSEWTIGAHAQDNNQKFGGMVEYRWSEPRIEANAHLQYKIFDLKFLHTYLTGGVTFQQYYDKINVWGMQVGLMMRLF